MSWSSAQVDFYEEKVLPSLPQQGKARRWACPQAASPPALCQSPLVTLTAPHSHQYWLLVHHFILSKHSASHSHIDLLPVALVLIIHGALQDLGGQVARSATDLCGDRDTGQSIPLSHAGAIPTCPPRWDLCRDGVTRRNCNLGASQW